MAAFRNLPNFTMCLGPGCESGQIHEGGDDQPIMTCSICRFKTCFIHKMSWHSEQTCNQYDEERKDRIEQETASANLIAETTKICPNPACGHGITKIGGCDHMTCKLLISPTKTCTEYAVHRPSMQIPILLYVSCLLEGYPERRQHCPYTYLPISYR